MLNTQKADTYALGQLLDELQRGAFVIPDFQREFAWNAADVRDLVQSIFLDYYIGNLLLWKATPEHVDSLACEGVSGFRGSLNPKHIVLDGQQRLTALHYAFFQPDVEFPGRKNPYLFFFRVNRFAQDRDDPEAFFYYRKTAWYERFIDDREQQYDRHTMPLTVLADEDFDARDWMDAYQEYWEARAEQADEDGLTGAQHAEHAAELKKYLRLLLRDYNVSYISLTEEVELAKVCEIFTKINAKGVRLDTFDLLNAITKPKGLQLKRMHREARAELPAVYGELNTKSYLLMIMSIIKQDYCSPKYLYYLVPGAQKTIGRRGIDQRQVVLVEDAPAFRELWAEAADTLARGIRLLSNARSYGAIRESFLPYPSILPAFSAIQRLLRFSTGIADPATARGKVAQWYWSAVFDERYSSSVETTTTGDYQRMRAWLGGGPRPEEILLVPERADEIDFHKVSSPQSARFRGVFALIVVAGARDWATYGLPEDNDLDDHHILPKACAKELSCEDLADSVLNRVPIASKTNRHVIGARMPNVYLREMLAKGDEEWVYRTLASHLISREAVAVLLREDFGAADFREFLALRQNAVRAAVREVLSASESLAAASA